MVGKYMIYFSIVIGGCRSLLASSFSNAVLIFSLVLLIPCFFLSICPSSVAGAKSGRYFCTSRAINTGHVENFLFLIFFRSVCLGGLNAAWWRYFMSAALVVMENALFAMFLVWTVCVSGNVLLYYCSGNIQNLVCDSRPPFRTSFIL